MVESGEILGLVKERISQGIIGLEKEIELMLVSTLSGGHILLEGQPGLGKTTLANTFSRTMGGEFRRIQMTPDLLPADVLGTYVYRQVDGSWTLREGPIFSNVVLVDEINRASPKVQAAFLEAMQEGQASIEGETIPLPEPFMVIATQVPYGEPGTYPLTNVQTDRFSYKIDMDYPSSQKELVLLDKIDEIEATRVEPVLGDGDLQDLKKEAKDIHTNERVRKYIVDLITNLRMREEIRTGPSPRASIWLLKGGRSLALIRGREYVIPDDIKYLAPSVLRHRMELTAMARASGTTIEELLMEALETTPVPKGPLNR
jgi:MoxR-like ATPase